jgi:acetoin utilization deacetylase AcuC-like enzyme
MEKYELIPGQLLYEGSYDQSDFFSPKPLKWELAAQVHTAKYIEALQKLTLNAKEARKIGLPMSAELVKRELIITQGTVDCCGFAIQNGVALNVAGGTHHAYAGSGEGFCILNDFAVAGASLLAEGKASKILIIDLDVHQGNGTAKIFENEKRVFTFSMHGKDNYPLRKEVSDLDIPLETGLSDKEYLSILRSTLDRLIAEQKPDMLFYVSGVDILETDKLGKLALSLEGCKERDRIVLETARKTGIPLVIAMGGGYSKQLRVIVEAHCNTFRLAKEIFN